MSAVIVWPKKQLQEGLEEREKFAWKSAKIKPAYEPLLYSIFSSEYIGSWKKQGFRKKKFCLCPWHPRWPDCRSRSSPPLWRRHRLPVPPLPKKNQKKSESCWDCRSRSSLPLWRRHHLPVPRQKKPKKYSGSDCLSRSCPPLWRRHHLPVPPLKKRKWKKSEVDKIVVVDHVPHCDIVIVLLTPPANKIGKIKKNQAAKIVVFDHVPCCNIVTVLLSPHKIK